MKVTLLQTNIRWAHPEENIREAERLIDTQPGADLYVLPEMWSTGFAVEPEGVAHEEDANDALQWMRHAAREHHCAICGSLAVHLAAGSYHNRIYFIDGRAGKEYFYDKRHLFSYGHEHEHYTAGDRRMIVNYEGMRLLLLVCYDLRFPCWSRYSEELEYDAIILVANWPQARQVAWNVLIRARAIENQCYMVAVNRVGDDCFGHYLGYSAAIDPIGRTIGECQPDRQEALTVHLDLAELQRRREKFCVLEDGDAFLLPSNTQRI